MLSVLIPASEYGFESLNATRCAWVDQPAKRTGEMGTSGSLHRAKRVGAGAYRHALSATDITA